MIGLGALAKLARGGIGPDQLGEILSAAGIEASFSMVPKAEEEKYFLALAANALNGGQIARFTAEMKGQTLTGLVCINVNTCADKVAKK